MNKKSLAAMLLIGLFSTAGAVAQEKTIGKKPDGEKMFAKIDIDKDGKISVAEADKAPQGKIKENFAAIDTNKDNFIDKEELKAYRKEKKAAKAAKQK